ncbi:hypothetical protein J5X84_39440 [Streptosporangiaceae bacterium NEAU-GS5]|nr:hypothetical protein [Streptosporangiaceae bacterium NEAU-GS5]
MDPDTALEHLRAGILRWFEAGGVDAIEAERDAAAEIVEAAISLDVWLSAGGFMPLAWRSHRNGAAAAEG